MSFTKILNPNWIKIMDVTQKIECRGDTARNQAGRGAQSIGYLAGAGRYSFFNRRVSSGLVRQEVSFLYLS